MFNIDSFFNKINDLKLLISNDNDAKPNIIILTEINAKHYKYPLLESELQICGYNLFTKNLSVKGYRGVAIYIDNRLQGMQI
jgi:exonuclease III